MKNISRPVVIISCGGTGGHMQPGLSLGEGLKNSGRVDVLFLINQKKISDHFIKNISSDYLIFPELEFSKIFSINIFSVLLNVIITIFKVMKLFFKYQVKMIISAGSASGIIPVFLMRLSGIPAVILEQNVVMGKANRTLLPFVNKAYLSGPCINVNPSPKIRITGNPLKESLIKRELSRRDAAAIFKLKEDRFTILFLGGSQGAKAINEFALKIMGEIIKIKPEIQVIHITGKTMIKECRNLYDSLEIPNFCEEFTDRMDAVYMLSDFAVSRAGGGAFAELSLFGIPAIYIPFPYAAEQHQKANAEYCSNSGGALMFDEKDIYSSAVKQKIMELLNDNNTLRNMRQKQLEFSRPDSTMDIVNDVLKSMGI